ncbi:hypothetical protein R3P38DRAFT_2812799 [Favolaschia claudopus]|uniref:Uncharacterized protein n=1 Tax=Favolaschia claudopus TaxID=2862362 RepID=A0AAV9Z655_9AGAR
MFVWVWGTHGGDKLEPPAPRAWGDGMREDEPKTETPRRGQPKRPRLTHKRRRLPNYKAESKTTLVNLAHRTNYGLAKAGQGHEGLRIDSEVASAKLGSFGAIVVIARIKAGNLVLPGARRYNILAEEDTPPTYEASEPLPWVRGTPYIEVAGTVDPDICSASGTSTQPTHGETGILSHAHASSTWAACALPGISDEFEFTHKRTGSQNQHCQLKAYRCFERLKGDDQKIVRALWALTGIPGEKGTTFLVYNFNFGATSTLVTATCWGCNFGVAQLCPEDDQDQNGKRQVLPFTSLQRSGAISEK